MIFTIALLESYAWQPLTVLWSKLSTSLELKFDALSFRTISVICVAVEPMVNDFLMISFKNCGICRFCHIMAASSGVRSVCPVWFDSLDKKIRRIDPSLSFWAMHVHLQSVLTNLLDLTLTMIGASVEEEIASFNARSAENSSFVVNSWIYQIFTRYCAYITTMPLETISNPQGAAIVSLSDVAVNGFPCIQDSDGKPAILGE